MSADTTDWQALRSVAEAVRGNAHAPYSGFTVGAALLAQSGRVFAGCNVENASYGLSLCAERSALSAAVAAGERRFVAIAIASPGPRPAPPCGMCRQALAEFPPAFEVRSYAPDGTELCTDMKALLPLGFGGEYLGK